MQEEGWLLGTSTTSIATAIATAIATTMAIAARGLHSSSSFTAAAPKGGSASDPELDPTT
jgi:hypothetical protein